MAAGDAVPGDLRHEGDAQPGADEFAHRIRAVAFQRDPRRESGGVAVHISDGPEALAGLEKNEARFGEVLQLH